MMGALIRLVGLGLLLLAAATAGAQPERYDRRQWPHWGPSAREAGCDVRFEVLVRDARYAARAEGRACRLAVGVWTDPYTGEALRAPARLDVDHLVPLRWAWRHGAALWDRERRTAYANDVRYPYHLLAASARANRQKGARGPAAWGPADRDARCAYGHRWVAVLFLWRLTPGDEDRAALESMLRGCRPVGHGVGEEAPS